MLGRTKVPPISENEASKVWSDRAPSCLPAGRKGHDNKKQIIAWKPRAQRGASHHVSSTKITSILTRYSIIFEFSTATLNSTTRSPVTPLKVFNALENPVRTASSNPLGDPEIISVTLATLGSTILITSFAVRSFT